MTPNQSLLVHRLVILVYRAMRPELDYQIFLLKNSAVSIAHSANHFIINLIYYRKIVGLIVRHPSLIVSYFGSR